MKKAQGLPITVIIIAALGLAILFILLYATIGKTRIFGESVEKETGLKDCKTSGGVPKDVTECTDPLLGNYGEKAADGKVVPLKPYQVCCKAQTS